MEIYITLLRYDVRLKEIGEGKKSGNSKVYKYLPGQ